VIVVALGNLVDDPGFQLICHAEWNALSGFTVIDDAFIAGVAVITQHKDLQVKLHFIGIPRGVCRGR